MDYQTVVDEVTSLLSSLLSPCHVSVLPLSLKEDEEEAGMRRRSRRVESVERTAEENKRKEARHGWEDRILNKWWKERGVKSCRGQVTERRGAGGRTEGRRKRRRVKANVVSTGWDLFDASEDWSHTLVTLYEKSVEHRRQICVCKNCNNWFM